MASDRCSRCGVECYGADPRDGWLLCDGCVRQAWIESLENNMLEGDPDDQERMEKVAAIMRHLEEGRFDSGEIRMLLRYRGRLLS